MKTVSERFWEKVDARGPDECWEWDAYVGTNGYGKFSLEGKGHCAHRVSFFLTYGHWPEVCRHTCDNPRCVNPAHLLDGTQRENMGDMMVRGRGGQPKGESNGSAKLTAEQVTEIRAAEGMSQRELAKIFGVSHTQICRIRSGKIWAHLD